MIMKKVFLQLAAAFDFGSKKLMTKNAMMAIGVVSVVSCTSVKPGDATLNENVPYKQAKNYFVKNNVQATLDNPKIETQADFDKIFGAAAFMGENGKPTTIDFSKEFVVAQTADVSAQKVDLLPVSIKKNANILEVKYRKVVGETQSFKSKPVMILIINKKYNGDVNLEEVQ